MIRYSIMNLKTVCITLKCYENLKQLLALLEILMKKIQAFLD